MIATGAPVVDISNILDILVKATVILALGLTVPTSLALLTVEPALLLMRQPPELVPLASGFVYRMAPGVFPLFAFVVCSHEDRGLSPLLRRVLRD